MPSERQTAEMLSDLSLPLRTELKAHNCQKLVQNMELLWTKLGVTPGLRLIQAIVEKLRMMCNDGWV